LQADWVCVEDTRLWLRQHKLVRGRLLSRPRDFVFFFFKTPTKKKRGKKKKKKDEEQRNEGVDLDVRERQSKLSPR
jgi:hypothetical protein